MEPKPKLEQSTPEKNNCYIYIEKMNIEKLCRENGVILSPSTPKSLLFESKTSSNCTPAKKEETLVDVLAKKSTPTKTRRPRNKPKALPMTSDDTLTSNVCPTVDQPPRGHSPNDQTPLPSQSLFESLDLDSITLISTEKAINNNYVNETSQVTGTTLDATNSSCNTGLRSKLRSSSSLTGQSVKIASSPTRLG
jgi:hypothetical protein